MNDEILNKILTKRNFNVLILIVIGIFIFTGIYITFNFNGYLVLESKSSDFKLQIDDEDVNYKLNEQIPVRVGSHKIKLSEDGAKTKEENINIKYLKETKFFVNLEPETDDSTIPELKLDDLEYN